jgi:undecaprenyl pyrophosphate phosphatase UppP
MQKKTWSWLESITNTLVGMVVNFLLGLVLYPAIGMPITHRQNLAIVLIFTGTSILRNYLVRRAFNGNSK